MAAENRDVIIGIDAGTSLIKAVAFTLAGEQLADISLPNAYSTLGGGHVEQDMARTWRDTVAVIHGLATAVPELPSRVAAIAVTGQGDGTWLIDDDQSHVAGDCGGRMLIAVTQGRVAARPGDIVPIALEPRHFHLFGVDGTCIRHAEVS